MSIHTIRSVPAKMSHTLYPLILDDGNCHLSTHSQEINDCSVRAFAIVTELPYDEVYSILAKAGRKRNRGFHSDKWLKKHKGQVLGGVFKPIKLNRTLRLTPLNFGPLHPKGRYILETEDHTWACLNSIHHDLWRVKQDEWLTGAWEFTR